MLNIKKTLHLTLDSFKNKIVDLKNSNSIKELIDKIFNRKASQTISTLEICKEVEPQLFQNSLKKALEKQELLLNEYALKQIGNFGLSQYKKEVEEIVKTSDNLLAKEVFEKINVDNITKDNKTTSKYLRSKNQIDKILLLNEICESEKANLPVITELLKDPNHKVKQAAIIAVAKLKEVTLLPVVIEYIDDSNYRSTVVETLLTFGSDMFDILDLSFYKFSFSSETLVQIVHIFEKAKTKKQYLIY